MLKKKEIVEGMMEVFSKSVSEILGEKVRCTYSIIPNAYKIGRLKELITEVTGISFLDMQSNKRDRKIVDARKLFCWFAFFECGINKTNIAFLINKDHTSVIHSIEGLKNFIACNDEFIMPLFNKIQTEIDEIETKS